MVIQMCQIDGRVEKIRKYVKALHCPTRWRIIDFIADGEKTTTQIQKHLLQKNENVKGSNLYFHLSELKKCGILKISNYLEKGGGAPEKVWKLKKTKIIINLLREESR